MIVRCFTFIFPSPTWKALSTGVFSDKIYDWVQGHEIVAAILSAFLILTQAIIINWITTRYRMFDNNSALPGLFYVLLTSSISDFQHLTPYLMANTFLLLTFANLMNIYKKNECAVAIFNAGLFIGIASLFHFSYVIFLLLVFIAIGVMRSLKIQELLMATAGFICIYWLVGAYYFWIDKLPEFWSHQIFKNLGFLQFRANGSGEQYLKIAFFIILTILVLLNANSYAIKRNILIQKGQTILYYALFIVPFCFLFQSNITLDFLIITTLPLIHIFGLFFQQPQASFSRIVTLDMVVYGAYFSI